MNREEAITKIFKKHDVPTSNPFFFEILKALEQEPCNNTISRETVKTEYKRRLESSLKDGSRGIDLTEFADCTAFNKFIDSIPPVKPQPCPEAISCSDMLDAIGHGTTYTSEDLQRIIKTLPPANPQPKIGHWIPLGNYDDWGNESSYKCSECGDIDTYPDNFCPNCGTKMKEGEG